MGLIVENQSNQLVLNGAGRSSTSYLERALNCLSGKWTVQILYEMRDRPVRLSALRRSHPSASKKALTASLRSLESAGIIVRRNLSTSVLHVEYELKEVMRKPVIELLNRLMEWGSLL